ncbi:MAG: hypothetical protein WC449_02105 [Candidatus Paceibacterota bacterium]
MTENLDTTNVLEKLGKDINDFRWAKEKMPSKLEECHDGGDDSEYFEDGYVLGKVAIFEHAGFLALDIQIKHRCGEDTLWAYCMLLHQYAFAHVGQVGSGIHRFVPTKFKGRPITFQKQYLGWTAMDIQAQFLACRFFEDTHTLNLDIL